MRKSIKIILVIIGLLVLGAWIYWQQNKKSIIKKQITEAITKGSDSVYFIRYDSSLIDAINGNATFYNVELQSDSLQKQLLLYDTAAQPTVFNIHIDEVRVRGANIPALLNNTKVQARSISIIHPLVYVINGGKKEKKIFKASDTLAIYEKILGKYNSINAEEINITNGYLNFADNTGQPQTAIRDFSVQLRNFRIDSTRDYQSVISYFIKDVVAKVKEVLLKTNSHFITFSDVEYNAPGKFISLKKFLETDSSKQVVFDVNNTVITNISTDAFILDQQIKADEFKTDGGIVKIYRQKKSGNKKDDKVEIENNLFDEAQVNKVSIGNTRVLIYNKLKPKEAPFILDNVRFSATDIQRLNSGTHLKELLSTSNWQVSANGFSFMSADKIYQYQVGAFDLNNSTSKMRIKSFAIIPRLSEEAFAKQLKYQHDLYDVELKNIEVAGIDTKALINDEKLLALSVSMQPIIKVFNDRTVTPNPESKVGKYPHQQLQQVKLPLHIQKLIIKNGSVAYKEKAALSKKSGVVFFKNINGTLENVTNIKEAISKNNLMVLNATTLFMGVGKIQTTWKLPLDTKNGTFTVMGECGRFNATVLNPVIEPLALASIKSGVINKLSFQLNGDDLKADGSTILSYNDLKIELLKKEDNELNKKDLMSFIANFLVKNNSEKDPPTKTVNKQRDINKSFFNLVWKSIFEGAKKAVQKI